MRTIELGVRAVSPLGSHTFFLAELLGSKVNIPGEEFHMIHGFYAAFRRHSACVHAHKLNERHVNVYTAKSSLMNKDDLPSHESPHLGSEDGPPQEETCSV